MNPDQIDQVERDVFNRAVQTITDLQAQLAKAVARAERAEKLIYVPGLTKCAKCGFKQISSFLNANSGNVSANNEPQVCPNGCGPMWKVSERDAGNDPCDRLDALTQSIKAKDERIADLEDGMREFLRIDGFISLHEMFEKDWEPAVACARALLEAKPGEEG